MPTLFGDRLKRAREHAGLSQEGLAEKVRELLPDDEVKKDGEKPLTQQAISKIENSRTVTKSYYTVRLYL